MVVVTGTLYFGFWVMSHCGVFDFGFEVHDDRIQVQLRTLPSTLYK